MTRKFRSATGVATVIMLAIASTATAIPIGPEPTLFSTAAANGAGGPGDMFTPGDGTLTPDVVNAPWVSPLGPFPPLVAINEIPAGPATNSLGLPGVGGLQVDAFSRGDDMDKQGNSIPGISPGEQNAWLFSVDTSAIGHAGAVVSEASGDGASADIFASLLAVGPGAGFAVSGSDLGTNTLVYEADGIDSAAGDQPGLGISDIEDVDAIDVVHKGHPEAQDLAGPNYFSLDTASAATVGGASGADIFVSTSGGSSLGIFASFSELGLANNDDIDALILADNDNGVFDPSDVFFDWNGGTTDMIFFSLAPGSPTVGTTDAVRGLAIEVGDILTVVGGATPSVAVFIPAEDLGLKTFRAHGVADNLNALDVVPEPATVTLALMGFFALGLFGWRKSRV